jgi:phosphoglycolate phosphatase
VIYLFDIDGTLISAQGAGRRAFERALAQEFGIADALRGVQLDGKTDPMILDEAFAAAGRGPSSDEDRARTFAAYLTHLPSELAQASYRVLPGVERALAYLESIGAVIGLATGNVEAGARHKLEHGGLWHRFAFGGYGSDAHARAELVRIAVERGRQRAPRPVAAEEVWVLGDTPRDIAAAHAAGVRAVGVATGSYDVAALTDAGADVVVSTLEEWSVIPTSR